MKGTVTIHKRKAKYWSNNSGHTYKCNIWSSIWDESNITCHESNICNIWPIVFIMNQILLVMYWTYAIFCLLYLSRFKHCLLTLTKVAWIYYIYIAHKFTYTTCLYIQVLLIHNGRIWQLLYCQTDIAVQIIYR